MSITMLIWYLYSEAADKASTLVNTQGAQKAQEESIT